MIIKVVLVNDNITFFQFFLERLSSTNFFTHHNGTNNLLHKKKPYMSFLTKTKLLFNNNGKNMMNSTQMLNTKMHRTTHE